MTASHGAGARRVRRPDPRGLPLPGRARGRVLRAGVGHQRGGRAGPRRPGRRAGRLRADRPRAEGPADRARPRRLGGPVRAGHRRRRVRPSWVDASASASPRRRPTSGRASTCWRRRWACGWSSRSRRRGGSRSGPTWRSRATGATSACAGSRRCGRSDGLRFTIRSDIPLSGGLGTSAAAYVAGLAAADALNGGGARPAGRGGAARGPPGQRRRRAAGRLRGLRGGRAERLEPPPGLSAVLVVPDRAVRTAKARAALPPEVPMGDAVFNVGRASLLVLGLARGDLDLVARGLEDRLHQPRRASLYPRSMDAGRAARGSWARWAPRSPGRGRRCWCGCGRRTRRRCRGAARGEAAGWARVMALPFAAGGVEVA